MFKIPLFPAKDKNDLVYLLTTLLGLPTIISRYFISPKHDYYFVFCKVNGRYIRRPTIKYYKPCDEFGLTTKLYKEIDIDIEEKEEFIRLLLNIITYNYKHRLTATEIIQNVIFNKNNNIL